MSTHSGTQMVLVDVSEPEPAKAHTLEEVLTISGRNGTEPFCSSFGPIAGTSDKPRFAALVMAYSASGTLDAAWMSEPVFGSPEAALDHAEDLVGPEIWPIISGYCEW